MISWRLLHPTQKICASDSNHPVASKRLIYLRPASSFWQIVNWLTIFIFNRPRKADTFILSGTAINASSQTQFGFN